MDGEGKKKAKKKALVKSLLKLKKKTGLSTAELIKFLVVRPDRKRKRKSKAVASKASPAPTSGVSAWNSWRPSAPTVITKEVPAATQPQTQIIVVPNVDRDIKANEIVPYKEGTPFSEGKRYLEIERDSTGKIHQTDITEEFKRAIGRAHRTLGEHKEGKSKAEEEAKHAREAKQKAEEAKELAAAEAKKAHEEKSKSDAKALKVLEEKLEHEAYTKTHAEWIKMPLKTVVAAAKAAGVKRINHPAGSKQSGQPFSREVLVTSTLTLGKKRYAAAKTYEEIKKVTDENKILDDYITLLEDMKKQQDGYYDQGGKGKSRLKRPTSNDEIDRAMSKVPGFQKTVASDDNFDVKGTPNPKGVSWVMNLDKSGEPGSHWVAVLITPHSVEYFDSFGDYPTPSVQERIVAAGKRLWPENVKTLKVNRIKHQDERTSTCGFHAMKFIRDRMSGQSFVDVTGYGKARSQVRKSEAAVKEFEARYPKFVQVGRGILDHPGDNMRDPVRRMLEQHGEEPITSLSVIRTPVQSAISTVLNVATLGAFKAALAKYNYDQLFHLAIEVNGRYVIEKNATVQFTSGTRSGGERKQAPVPAGVKVKDLFKRGSSAGFWLYDPRTNNCQDFIITILAGIGALTFELRVFIKQDAAAIFATMPAYAGKLAKFVTDLGGRFDGAKDKIAKFFRGRGTPAEGAQKTIDEMKRSMAESSHSLEQDAKRRGITLNDQAKTPPGFIVKLLRKLGAEKAAKAFHKWDYGEELQGGMRLGEQYVGKPPAYKNKGPYSWIDSSAIPRIDLGVKTPVLA